MSSLGKPSLVVAALGSDKTDILLIEKLVRGSRIKGGEWGDQRLVSLPQGQPMEVRSFDQGVLDWNFKKL